MSKSTFHIAPASPATHFYLQKPAVYLRSSPGNRNLVSCWNISMPILPWVIEAKTITTPFQGRFLEVVSPARFQGIFTFPEDWIECSGPVKELTRHEYVVLIRSLRPDLPEPGYFCSHAHPCKSDSP
jgi:hypothetical protein